MPDMMLIQGAISSLKTAADIAKGLFHLKSQAEVQTTVIDLQEAILSAQSNALAAQSEQFEMIQRIGTLEEELTRVKAWGEEKQRYQLITPWEGCHVYALKQSCKETEPAHWICEHCYQDGRKSILQNDENRRGDRRSIFTVKCSHCSFEIERRGPAKREYAADR